MSRLRRADRGGVATIVALLLAFGVLLGMSALVVDVGRLYAEREELQSGADSAAYAIALDCAKNRPACATSAAGVTADGYADDNARDGRSAIDGLCGRDGQNRLPSCLSAPNNNLTDCLGTVPAGVKYVEVRTKTELRNGDFVLPPSFAQTMASGNAGTTVGACARVAWGPPAGGLAVTMSVCEYNAATSNGTVFAPPPPYPPDPNPALEQAIRLHGPGAATCNPGSPPAGWDFPGGFGWLDETGGPCRFATETDLDYGGNTGNTPSQDCRTALVNARNNHTVLLVPIYEWFQGQGQRATYRLARIAGFVVTGYYLSGGQDMRQPSNVHPSFDPCRGNDHCIYGFFVDVGIIPGEAIGVGPDLGVTVIKTIG
jgi:hypothetical protein